MNLNSGLGAADGFKSVDPRIVLRPWFRKSMSILSSRISLTCPTPNVPCSIQFVGFHFIKVDFRLPYSALQSTKQFAKIPTVMRSGKRPHRTFRKCVAQRSHVAAPPDGKLERPRGRATSVPLRLQQFNLMYNRSPAQCLFKIAHLCNK